MPPAHNSETSDEAAAYLIAQVIITAGIFFTTAVTAAAIYAEPNYFKQPYHTSKLTGQAWVEELIHGHPEHIHCELGMHVHVFLFLCSHLHQCELVPSRYVSLEEKVAIFLYTCVTGLSVCHVGERFQRSNDTISKCFHEVLKAATSPAFYNANVYLPTADTPISDFIRNNPRFFPFFAGAIGAIDGTHIPCAPNKIEQHLARDRKGMVSQNILAACDWGLRFTFLLTGWEGATADAQMYDDTRFNDLFVDAGKYFIADAGFGTCSTLIVPYQGVRYHLAEWARANVRPVDAQELYNLRHASARNVIKRIFGVLKKRFQILNQPKPGLPMDAQAQIPAALAAIHNFIIEYDPEDIHKAMERLYQMDDTWDDPQPGWCAEHDLYALAQRLPGRAEKAIADTRRDQIAQNMWNSYQEELERRRVQGMNVD